MTPRILTCWIILTVSVGLYGEIASAKMYPHIDGLIEDARTLRLSGRFSDAEAKLGRAQRIAPRSADVYLEYAYLRKDQGNYDDLKNVVEVGADVADGPPSSLAQLKILRNKLSAVSLPVSPDQSFSTPPAIAQIPGDTRLIRGPELATSDTQREVDPISVSSESRSGELGQGVSKEVSSTNTFLGSEDRDGGTISIDQQQASLESSTDLKSEETAKVPEAKTRQATQQEIVSADSGMKMDQPEPRTEAVKSSSVGPGADAKDGKQATAPTNEAGPAKISDRDEKPQQVVSSFAAKGHPLSADSSSVGPRYRSKTTFVGLGILGRVQSGTWMSRGPIETDY